MSDDSSKSKQFKDLFFDKSSQASDVGKLTVNPFRWMRFNWQLVLKKLGWLALSIFLMVMLHWIFVLMVAGFAVHIFWYCFKVYHTYQNGDVNPGKVISLHPTLVAVSTNMTKGFGNFPVMTIIKTTLPEKERVLGKIIVTAATYHDNPHGYPFWAEFHPMPMSHATGDELYLFNRLSRFSKEQIGTIDRHLVQLGHQWPGIFKMDVADSDWKDYPQVILAKGVKMAGPPKGA